MPAKDKKPDKTPTGKDQQEQPYRRPDFLRDLRKVSRRQGRDRDKPSQDSD